MKHIFNIYKTLDILIHLVIGAASEGIAVSGLRVKLPALSVFLLYYEMQNGYFIIQWQILKVKAIVVVQKQSLI